MEIYIVLALLLTLFQTWLIPMAINIKNFSWLISARDSSPTESTLLKRARRASANLHESLAGFLALVLAAMYLQVDVSNLACWWLILRVIHGISYLAAIPLVRTIAYIGSIVCMVMMALVLI
tara:strand:+ start:1392 stop:1757 length:366 start_codon:yes stop_codon:yes gene_type:complete